MKLFEISAEYNALRAAIDANLEENGGEITLLVEDQLELLSVAIADKAKKVEAIASIILELEADADARKSVAKKIAEHGKAQQSHADRLRKYLSDNMNNGEKIPTVIGNVSAKVNVSTVIDDASVLPESMRKIEYSGDKAAIKKAIQEGERIDGAHLEYTKSVSIR